MANANTNIMSVNINQPAASTGSSSRNSGLQSTKNSSQKGGSDFNSALDRANEKLNQQNQPVQENPSNSEEISYADAATKNPESPVESKDAKTASTQGQNQQTQDAPQNTTVEKNIPAEINVTPTENISPVTEIPAENTLPIVEIPTENISPKTEINPAEIPDTTQIQPVVPYFFATNAESLLPSQTSENTGEVNLMTIMPKNDADKSQTMLNLLGGKTWTSEDVQATISPQPAQNFEFNPETLPIYQVGKNLNQNQNQPQNLIQNQNAENLQQSPQILNQQSNLNIQPQQIQTQPADLNFQPQQIQNQPAEVEFQPQQLQQQPQIQNQAADLNIQPQQLQQQQIQPQQQIQIQTQPQVELQQQPILNSLQPQIDVKQVNQQQSISDLLGANITVENNQSANTLPPVQQVFNQQPEQNQQQTNQNLQQNFAQDLNSEMQVQQQNSGGESTFVQNFAPVADNTTNTQPIVQTQNPEAAAQAARENESIPAQIVQQARMIRTAENTEMVINLKPEHLGQLTLRVSVSQNGAVNASFYSDNAQVRAVIENSLVQLRQELNDQGLKVDNVQVSSYLNDSGLMNGQGGQAWQQNQQQSANRRIDFDALQEEVDAVTPNDENISADGVDYKV